MRIKSQQFVALGLSHLTENFLEPNSVYLTYKYISIGRALSVRYGQAWPTAAVGREKQFEIAFQSEHHTLSAVTSPARSVLPRVLAKMRFGHSGCGFPQRGGAAFYRWPAA